MNMPWQTPPVQSDELEIPAFLKRDENNRLPQQKFPWQFVCPVCGDDEATEDGCRLCGAGPSG